MNRALLGTLLGGCVIAVAAMAADGMWLGAGAVAGGGIYFALRFTGRLGPRNHP
jgi:hypothetical protein